MSFTLPDGGSGPSGGPPPGGPPPGGMPGGMPGGPGGMPPGMGGIAPADLVASGGGTPYQTLSGRQRFWRRLRSRPEAMTAAAFLVFLVLVAIFAPQVAPKDPYDQNLRDNLQGPSSQYWLGTDQLGRDVLSRIIYGGRVAIQSMMIATVISAVIGVPIGIAIGFIGGWLDRIVMRILEVLYALPQLVVLIAIIGIMGPGLRNAMIALGLFMSTAYIRLLRGEVLAAREDLYVDSARVIGSPTRKIMFKHVLPNVLPTLLVTMTLLVGAVLLAEAGLSFLGLGAQPPQASWGAMLQESLTYIGRQPFLAVPPGIIIVITIMAVNLVGDAVRDSVGRGMPPAPPRRRRRQAVPEVDAEAILAEAAKELSAFGSARFERAPDTALLAVDGLSVSFPTPQGGVLTILQGSTFHVMPGETLGLVGESGSGKSMTALAVMGLIPSPGQVVAGSVKLNGIELTELSDNDLRKTRGTEIGMIFQDPMSSMNPSMTVGDQIGEALRIHKGYSKKAARERATDLLDLVGVPDPSRRVRAYPHEMSGGMAQRCMIAMALACEPKLLIADEPTTALDVTIQGQVLDLLRRLKDELGMSILFITHDLGVVAEICDRAAVMYAGQVVEQATVNELFTNPQHPYTEGLLRAMPQNTLMGERLRTIPGQVPEPWAWPTGCRYHPRCPYAQDACTSDSIDMQQLIPAHIVRCRRAEELQLEAAQ